MDNIIINADDFGYSEFINKGIAYCFNNDLIDRTTVMVNMNSLEDAKRIAEDEGFLNRVGFHLNIVEGMPLTEQIKKTELCNSDGSFNNLFFRNTRNRLIINKEIRSALKDEIEAQIDKFFSTGFVLKHMDSHQHSHNNLSVLEILAPLVKKNFTSVRLSRNIPINEIKGYKRVYKNIVNNKIISFNHDKDIKYFGSYRDVEIYLQSDNIDKVELEVHPAFVDGKLVDLYNDENVEKWIRRLENCQKNKVGVIG